MYGETCLDAIPIQDGFSLEVGVTKTMISRVVFRTSLLRQANY
jgi:hypothetical protein